MYDGNSLQTDGLPYDIALLEVDTPIEFNTQIQPACLPTHEDMDVVGNNNCWISGWGLTKGDWIIYKNQIDVFGYNLMIVKSYMLILCCKLILTADFSTV